MKIEIKNLCFGYIKKPLCILDLNLQIFGGEKVLVLGGESMGKTALLRVLCGLEKLYAGSIKYNSKELGETNISNLNISYLPSEPVLLNKTVKDNIDYLCLVNNIPYLSSEEMQDIFNKFNFSAKGDDKVKKLSLTDKRLLCFIRSYIKNPDVFLIDDQLSDLDENSVNLIKNAKSVLINEKNASKPAFFVCKCKKSLLDYDKILYLSYGKNYVFNSLDELLNSAIDLFVFNYFDNAKYDLFLTLKDNKYFLCEMERVILKKKQEELVVKNYYKLSDDFMGKFKDLELYEDEFFPVVLVDNLEDKTAFKDEIINTKLKGGLMHLFASQTGTKII